MKTNMIWATITVQSIERSLPFYQDLLGLEIVRRFMPHPGLELCFLKDENGMEIELLEHKSSEVESVPPAVAAPSNLTLGFKVEDLNAALETCQEKGIAILSGPFEGGGVRFFFVKDPDGISIQFVQN
jgi:lactoylglutathione lyase